MRPPVSEGMGVAQDALESHIGLGISLVAIRCICAAASARCRHRSFISLFDQRSSIFSRMC
jgi:hypothetical protein